MKASIIITMLIVGGCLILAPLAFNALHEHEMALTYIARPDITNLQFGDADGGALSSLSRFCYGIVGGLLILFAVRRAGSDQQPGVSPAPALASPSA